MDEVVWCVCGHRHKVIEGVYGDEWLMCDECSCANMIEGNPPSFGLAFLSDTVLVKRDDLVHVIQRVMHPDVEGRFSSVILDRLRRAIEEQG